MLEPDVKWYHFEELLPNHLSTLFGKVANQALLCAYTALKRLTFTRRSQNLYMASEMGIDEEEIFRESGHWAKKLQMFKALWHDFLADLELYFYVGLVLLGCLFGVTGILSFCITLCRHGVSKKAFLVIFRFFFSIIYFFVWYHGFLTHDNEPRGAAADLPNETRGAETKQTSCFKGLYTCPAAEVHRQRILNMTP